MKRILIMLFILISLSGCKTTSECEPEIKKVFYSPEVLPDTNLYSSLLIENITEDLILDKELYIEIDLHYYYAGPPVDEIKENYFTELNTEHAEDLGLDEVRIETDRPRIYIDNEDLTMDVIEQLNNKMCEYIIYSVYIRVGNINL